MKKLTIRLFVIIHAITKFASAQTETENLEKYWNYRERLHKYFVRIGNGTLPNTADGYSICAANRQFNPTAGSLVGLAPNGYAMRWGDAMANHGEYLSTLATEYKLRKDAGMNVQPILNELYYAISAINRVDLSAEDYLSNSSLPKSLNGFFMRDDVPESFYTHWLNEYTNTEDPKDNLTIVDGDAYNVEYHATNDFNSGNTMSQDQVIGLFVGFALIRKFVDNDFVQPRPTDAGFRIVDEVAAITTRIMERIRANYEWIDYANCWTRGEGAGKIFRTSYSSNWVAVNPGIKNAKPFPFQAVQKDPHHCFPF